MSVSFQGLEDELSMIAGWYRVTLDDVLGHGRDHLVLFARAHVAHRLLEVLGELPAVARYLNRADTRSVAKLIAWHEEVEARRRAMFTGDA